MATKFKFEIESDGLTVEQASAFSIFVKSLSIAVSVTNDVQAGLIKLAEIETAQSERIVPEYAEGIKKDIVDAVENTKKRRATRAKAKEVISETPMQIDARNMDVVEEVQAEEVQAEEVQAEEVQAEEVQPKPTKTSAYSIQDVRDRVKEKQVKWRTVIKAELERLGSSSVSLLDPKHFEEFCNFMDNLA